jgi:lantibiotic modifying enzyme
MFFDGGVESQTSTFVRFYPELTRLWLLQMENWRVFRRTFQCDLAKFLRRQAIRSPAARIVALQPDMSDFHNGNKSVFHVYFANGEEWFYKPRCAGQSTAWFELLARINRAGFSHPFTIPRLVPDQEHHWMEAIRDHPCRSSDQQRDFWFRSGALLWLVNALAGVDFHIGNLVCQGDQPVFVDCETLLHPLTSGARDRISSATRLGRTGMLPPRGRSDAAALGPMTASRVCGRRRCLSPRDICCAVVDGWKAMTRFLAEPKRMRMLGDTYDQLKSIDYRLIHRSTAQYHSILRYSFAPALLKDSTRRLAFLRQACQNANASRLVADEEVRALMDLDIPVFFGRCRRRTAPFPPSQSKHTFRTLASCLAAAFPATAIDGGTT